jgi:hypothetical protein
MATLSGPLLEAGFIVKREASFYNKVKKKLVRVVNEQTQSSPHEGPFTWITQGET